MMTPPPSPRIDMPRPTSRRARQSPNKVPQRQGEPPSPPITILDSDDARPIALGKIQAKRDVLALPPAQSTRRSPRRHPMASHFESIPVEPIAGPSFVPKTGPSMTSVPAVHRTKAQKIGAVITHVPAVEPLVRPTSRTANPDKPPSRLSSRSGPSARSSNIPPRENRPPDPSKGKGKIIDLTTDEPRPPPIGATRETSAPTRAITSPASSNPVPTLPVISSRSIPGSRRTRIHIAPDPDTATRPNLVVGGGSRLYPRLPASTKPGGRADAPQVQRTRPARVAHKEVGREERVGEKRRAVGGLEVGVGRMKRGRIEVRADG